MRRGWAALLAGIMLVGVACETTTDKERTVTWDLRQPTTTRQLGGRSDLDVTVESPAGGSLEVEILLPQTTVRGTYDMVSGTLSDVTDVGPESTIGIVQLYELDVTSVAALRGLVDRFDSDWPLADGERAQVDTLLAEMAAKEAASGRVTLDDYPLVLAWGFDAAETKGVQASLTIRVVSGGFSAYRVLRLVDDGS